MRKYVLGLTLWFCFALAITPFGQTGVEGRWLTTDFGGSNTFLDFTVQGSVVSGEISNPNARPITDGRLEGDTLTFVVLTPAGPIAFTGKVGTNEIAFTRSPQLRDEAAIARRGIFGGSGPIAFVAKRGVAAPARPPLSRMDPPLFDAIRRGDTAAVKDRLAAGGSANALDDTGASALMQATAFADASMMRLLIEAGADVNVSNTFGSTALMWSVSDTSKVRLLLDRGANPNARAIDQSTALLGTARVNNVEGMRLLIARGADPKAGPRDLVNLLREGLLSNDATIRRVLIENGVELKDATELPQGAVPRLARLHDPGLLRQALDFGLDLNAQLRQTSVMVPPVALVASDGDVESLRMVIDRGADPKAAGSRGWTALMMAAAAERPDPKVVALLLEKGVDVNARDDGGRTALDWALLDGETPVSRQLRTAGARAMAPAASVPVPVSTPRTPRAAVEKAIARLQPIGPTFFQETKCISCHNQSLPAMAVKIASDRGVPVDKTIAAHPSEATLATWKASRERVLLGDFNGIGGFVANVSYGLVAMADEGLSPNTVTDAMAVGLATSQRPDGSFGLDGAGTRPPLGGGSDIHMTALAVRALAAYAPPGLRAETTARIGRALAFLEKAQAFDTQDESFKLMGLVWAGAPASERAAQASRLLALQRKDGGLGQLPTLASDAYATGQALYALHLSGAASTSDGYKRGAAYLLRTQLEDGTWFVRSRAFGFQPYFESGFPHGRDQFISAAATAWAAIALAYML